MVNVVNHDLQVLSVPIGPLSSVASLHHNVAGKLSEFSERYLNGEKLRVVYDMSAVQPKHMNMAALTAFLSISTRLRNFTPEPIQIKIPWNPDVFTFWDDIGLFKLANENDLFLWQPGMVGGYQTGRTNPNTQLLYYEPSVEPQLQLSKEEKNRLKDSIRASVKESIMLQCGAIFKATKNSPSLSVNLKDQIAVTSAELVVNSHIWGQSGAFLGLQRSSKGVTVSVCDSGIGFYRSLYNKDSPKIISKPNSHLEALILGCVMNTQDFGLRRAIEMVTNYGGWVISSSYSAEITWKLPLWNEVMSQISHNLKPDNTIDQFINVVLPCKAGKVEHLEKERGFCRDWKTPLRGSRISFELPFNI